MTTLSQKLLKELFATYHEYTLFGPYHYDAIGSSHRSIRNTILGYILSDKTQPSIDLALSQYNKSNNMTDKIAALGGLASVSCKERTECLLDFYSTWSTNPLVVNKWLSVQALADLDDVLDNVKKLMTHEAFDIKNPNKVYALIGGFCGGNTYHFHNLNGSGYKFLADVVLQLNAINPQVAARMLTPLTQWHRLDVIRKKLMCSELDRIKQTGNLSPDVMEIITKSLGVRCI